MLSDKPRIRFFTGDPGFHPIDQQVTVLIEWLGDRYDYEQIQGAAAFDNLDGVDLLVPMGLHWTGMPAEKFGYTPLSEAQQQSFEAYVASGRPLLVHHAAIGSFDDWPRYGALLGFTWVWGVTDHSRIQDHSVQILPKGHPVVEGLDSYTIVDELYFNIQITPGFIPAIHAEAEYQGLKRPMIMTGEGGRVEGAGRVIYLAHGHDMRAFECTAMRKLWTNSVDWLLHRRD